MQKYDSLHCRVCRCEDGPQIVLKALRPQYKDASGIKSTSFLRSRDFFSYIAESSHFRNGDFCTMRTNDRTMSMRYGYDSSLKVVFARVIHNYHFFWYHTVAFPTIPLHVS